MSVRSRAHAETFDAGRRSFVNEARLLARFDHRSLVKVHRFWEQHGTAYMAMPFYRGRTLKALVRDESYPRFDEARLRALVDPLLGALQMLHAGGVYHRDIAPDNIMVCDDDAPVLLDFGAARHVIGEATHALTAVLKPSFAPIEQYAEAGTALRQGPWTDIYAMAAVMRFALTGNAPLPATTRVVLDAMAPLQSIGVADASAPLLGAIDWALAVRPQDRPQSVAQWRDALDGRIALPPAAGTTTAAAVAAGPDTVAAATWAQTVLQALPAAAPPRRPSRRRWLWLSAGALVFGFGVMLAIVTTPPTNDAANEAMNEAPPPATTIAEPPAVVERPPPRAAAPNGALPALPPTAKATSVQRLAASPREACGERVLLAMARCMMRECERQRFATHPECLQLHEQQARRRERLDQPQ